MNARIIHSIAALGYSRIPFFPSSLLPGRALTLLKAASCNRKQGLAPDCVVVLLQNKGKGTVLQGAMIVADSEDIYVSSSSA